MADPIKLFKKFPILSNFSDKELAIVINAIEIKHYQPSQFIVHEGDKSDDLFFLLEGNVIVSKKHPTVDQTYELGEIASGGVIGDMNFIEYQSRSASVTAKNHCTIGVLSKEKLLAQDLGEKIYEKLIKNISKVNIVRLKQANDDHVRALHQEKEQLELRIKFGKFFTIIIIGFGLSGVVNDLVLNSKILNTHSDLFNWAYLLIILILILYYVKQYGFKLAELGITTKNWQRSVIESVLISAVFTLLCLVSAYLYLTYFHGSFNYSYDIAKPLFFLDYAFHAFAQEFIARGVTQTSLQRFFNDTKGNFSILITSTLFFIFHMHEGLVAGGAVFLASLLLGWMYNRQKNLIGVTIFHLAMGYVGHYFGLIP